MASETLAAGLERYNIGPKVRALRVNKGLRLEQLGKHTGLSVAMLSKIERGRLFPTLPTLLRIAMVFGVGLEHFFTESTERPLVSVIRQGDRIRLPNAPDDATGYFFESLDFPVSDRRMETFYAEFPLNSKPTAPHDHPGAELIYVMRGQLALDVDGEEVTLSEGDSVYFDSGVAHSYRREGRGACTAIVVVSPRQERARGS